MKPSRYCVKSLLALLLLIVVFTPARADEASLQAALQKLAELELTVSTAIKEISGDEEYAKYTREKATWEKARTTQATRAGENDPTHYATAYRAEYEKITLARAADLQQKLQPVSN